MGILCSYLRRFWKLGVAALALATIGQTLALLEPLLFRHVIDEYAMRYREYRFANFLRGVGSTLLGVIAVAIASRVARQFHEYLAGRIAKQIGADLYSDGLRHCLGLPYFLFEDQRSGETLSRLENARTDVERLLMLAIGVVFTTAMSAVFVVFYAYRVHWSIAPAFLLAFVMVGGSSIVLSRRIKAIQNRILGETAALAGRTTEALRNVELVKSLGLAGQEMGNLDAANARILGLELQKLRHVRALGLAQNGCVYLARTCIFFQVLCLIFTEHVTVGQLFSLNMYAFYLFLPLQDLGSIINAYRVAEASLDNLRALLAQPLETHANSAPIAAIEELRFENVSFRHRSSTEPAVRDISFRARRGECVAFVGPSGAGKTTVVKLIAGLYQPQSGHIYYNDASHHEVSMDEMRKRIGLVTQDTQLFAGSIRDNLQFVHPGAADADCVRALHQASLQGLLDRAVHGLDTAIGEGGVKVSGGEKQRISIARALLRRPSLLLFDEATSSLDSLTEVEVARTVRDAAVNSDAITVMVAHRLSTVLDADRIYVLERGSIVECGAHDELVAMQGLYHAMWRQQSGEARLLALSKAQ